MKTFEDEAFDDLAKKQGMWGGGFQAKRAMAADRDALFKKFEIAQPAHSEWNAALDEAASRINEITAFPKITQDSFAVFIQGLKK